MAIQIFRLIGAGNECRLEPMDLGATTCEMLLASRALSYGQGAFETLFVVSNRVPLLPRHMDRMAKAASVLGLQFDRDAVTQMVCSQLALLPATEGVLKLSLLAGALQTRGYAGSEMPQSLFRLEFFPGVPRLPWQPWSTPVYRVARVNEAAPAWPKALVGLKLTDSLEYVLWSTDVKARGFDEGVLFDGVDSLIEGTSSNVILLTPENSLVTPPILESGVQGVLRDELVAQGLVSIKKLTEADIYRSKAFFMINSVRGLVAISEYNGWDGHRDWRTRGHKVVEDLCQFLRALYS